MGDAKEREPVVAETAVFRDRLTSLFCQEGSPRAMSLIVSLLMFTPGAWSIDELAAELKLSKASISLMTRMVEQQGMIERVFVPGERKVHFRLATGAMENILRRQIASMSTLRDLLREASEELPPTKPEIIERLAAFASFFDFLAEHIPELIAHWKGERETVFGELKEG